MPPIVPCRSGRLKDDGGAPNFAARNERARALRSSSTRDKIGSPAPRCAAPAASLIRPDRPGVPVPSSTQKEGMMIAISDQIHQLQAELHSCFFTKVERAKAQAELAALIAQEQAKSEKRAKDIHEFLVDLE